MKTLLAVIMALTIPLCVQAKTKNFPEQPVPREFDMLELPCGAIFQSEGASLLLWIDGYISADQGVSKNSPEWQKKLANFVLDMCNESPETKIIDIIERAPSKKR